MDNPCKHLITETYQTTDGLDGPVGGRFGKFGTKCANCGYILTTGWWDGTRTIDKPKMPEVSVSLNETYSFMSNGEFGVKMGVEGVWYKMNYDERVEYIDLRMKGDSVDGAVRLSPEDFVKLFDFCGKMKEKYK